MDDILIPVTKIQKFCTHDGPGVRTVVFFKGCPLNCKWCHNPETKSFKKQFFFDGRLCIGCGECFRVCPWGAHVTDGDGHIVDHSLCVGCMNCTEVCPSGSLEPCSKDMTVSQIMNAVLADRAFYTNGGGMTVSGGEPTARSTELLALLRAARDAGVSTALETCGYCDHDLIRELVPLVDIFLWDVKDMDDIRHRENTGVSNRRIIDNLKYADSLGARTVMRCIVVRGVNDDERNFGSVAELYGSLSNCEGVELIPYHRFGASKGIMTGAGDTDRDEWIPANDDLTRISKRLSSSGVKLIH